MDNQKQNLPFSLRLSQPMPRQHQPNLNNTLAQLLDENVLPIPSPIRKHRRHCRSSQRTPKHLHHRRRPRAPLSLKPNLNSAISGEEETKNRFKTPRLKNENRSLEAIIASIYPETLRQTNNLKATLVQARLHYCVFHANNDHFPKHSQLEGFTHDLPDLITFHEERFRVKKWPSKLGFLADLLRFHQA